MPIPVDDNPEGQLLILTLCREIVACPRNAESIQNALAKLEAHPDKNQLINRKTYPGYSVIYYAVKMGDLEVINRLIEMGVDLTGLYDLQYIRKDKDSKMINDPRLIKDKENNVYQGLTLRDLVQQEMIMGNDQKHYWDYVYIDRILEQHKVTVNDEANKKFREQFNRLEEKAKGYTQFEIRELIAKKGYPHLSEGYCFAVACMGAQAFLIEERDKENNLVHLDHFAQRANYLKANKEGMYREIDRSDHRRRLLVEYAQINKIDINETLEEYLSVQDNMNLEIDPLLNGIVLFQKFYEYDYLLTGKFKFNAMRLIPNILLEKQGGAVVVDQLVHEANEAGFLKLLLQIEQTAGKNSYLSPIVLELGSKRHALTIGYDPVKLQWRVIDANHTDEMLNYYNAQDMAKLTRKNLSVKNENERLLIEINIISTASRAKELTQKIVNPVFHNLTYSSARGKAKHFIARHKAAWIMAAIALLSIGLGIGFLMIANAMPSTGYESLYLAISAGIIMSPGVVITGGLMGYVFYTSVRNKELKKHLRESINKYEKSNERVLEIKKTSSIQVSLTNQQSVREKTMAPGDVKSITAEQASTLDQARESAIAQASTLGNVASVNDKEFPEQKYLHSQATPKFSIANPTQKVQGREFIGSRVGRSSTRNPKK